MPKLIIPIIASIIPLSGCAVPMICGPMQSDGYTRCDPVAYTQPAPAVSYVPPLGPGYAPAYPPHQPYVLHRRHEWVTDTPHWNPGDE
jgi:hypothetical protein